MKVPEIETNNPTIALRSPEETGDRPDSGCQPGGDLGMVEREFSRLLIRSTRRMPPNHPLNAPRAESGPRVNGTLGMERSNLAV
jgi:hypothetical protein